MVVAVTTVLAAGLSLRSVATSAWRAGLGMRTNEAVAAHVLER
jgi:hypothetical protein